MTIDINDIEYGITNYAHPNNMSDIDRNMFTFQYPPNIYITRLYKLVMVFCR